MNYWTKPIAVKRYILWALWLNVILSILNGFFLRLNHG